MASPGSNIGKLSFYGKRSKDYKWQVRLARKEKQINKFPMPTPYKPKLGGPSSYWKVFKSQQDAFDFVRAVSEDLHVFSCESKSFFDHHGQRLYLVTSYDQFWHYYRQLGSPQRHHYEVVTEGAVCKLYFDLEFSRDENPDRNGNDMVEHFIKYVNNCIREDFNITCEKCNILQLDASTEQKFSQHLIYLIPDTVFKDNISAGNYVHKICSPLLQHVTSSSTDGAQQCKRLRTAGCVDTIDGDTQQQTPGSETGNPNTTSSAQPTDNVESICSSRGISRNDAERFLVKSKCGDTVLFCDTGVYTKNRNFRLLLSCKLGKDNPLLVANSNQYLPDSSPTGQQNVEEFLFLDSLITNIKYHPGLRVLSVAEDGCLKAKRNITTSSTPPNREHSDCLGGYKTSPYPEIDRFITSLLTRGGTQGHIRHWAYFSSGELLVYDIAKNRWCENIGRQHKSNNVIYVVDLRRGIYYQKCHDQQCKDDNFKSTEYPLPENVHPKTYFGDLLTEQSVPDIDDVSDEDLLLAVNVVESGLTDENSKSSREKQLTGGWDFDPDDDDALLAAVELAETGS